jgi:D-amino peptidase
MTNSMKIYILADIEGAAGVTNYARQCQAGGEGYPLAKSWLTREINAAIADICEEAPRASVLVWDGHGEGCVNLEALDERAEYVPRGSLEVPYLLDASFNGLFFVGQHARASSGGVLCHTFTFAVERMWLNGVEVGEFGCRAAMAGVLGVPVLFLSGDDYAAREAEELIPGMTTVATKRSLHENLAVTAHPRRACELIWSGARRAIRQLALVAPLRLAPLRGEFAYEQTIQLKRADDFACWFEGRPEAVVVQAVDERTAILRSHRLFDLHL